MEPPILLGRIHVDWRLEATVNEWSVEQINDFLLSRKRFTPEVVSETVKRVLEKLKSGLIVGVNLKAYSIGVAMNVKREFDRKKPKHEQTPYDIAIELPEVPAIPPAELKALMKRVLCPTEREFLNAYIRDSKNIPAHRERLARRLGVTMEVLYKRVSRLKTKLAKAYEAEKQAGRKS